jgi:hypothetical protein
MSKMSTTISGRSNPKKLRAALQTIRAKWIVRILAMCIFFYVFYQARRHFEYIPLDARLIYRCAWWGSVASFGLFLSSFSWVRRLRLLGFFVYLPTVPSVLFVSPSPASSLVLLVLLLVYPYIVFFVKEDHETESDLAQTRVSD